MAEGIFREPTDAEKKDWDKDLMNPEESKLDLWNKKLIAKQQEFTKLGKPFCFRCAKIDLKNLIDDQIREHESKQRGYVKFDKINIEFPNLAQYSDLERFEVTADREILEPANPKKGTPAQIVVSKEYKCKRRGCGISIMNNDVKTEDLSKVQQSKDNNK